MKLKIILSLNIFFCGPRKLDIILTQLRNSASFLSFDLFRVGIVSYPSCRCGAALENLKHFFLDCPIYIQARTILIGNINRVTTCYTLDIEILTCGNDNLTDEQNCIIFKYVFDYIKCSKRFLIVKLEMNWVNMHIIRIHLNFI
jgi:hypothetical protein